MALNSPVNIVGQISGAYNTPSFNVKDQGLASIQDVLTYLLANSGGSGGASSSIYSSNGWIIKGTSGITVTGSNGLYTVNVPTNGILEAIQKNHTSAGEFTGDGNIVLTINWNTSTFNTSFANALTPTIYLLDNAGTHRAPNTVGVTVQTATPSGGSTVTTIAGINGLGIPVRTKAII